MLVAAARMQLNLIVTVAAATRTRLRLIANAADEPRTWMRLIIAVTDVAWTLLRFFVSAIAAVWTRFCPNVTVVAAMRTRLPLWPQRERGCFSLLENDFKWQKQPLKGRTGHDATIAGLQICKELFLNEQKSNY